ncbi:MAG: dipeptide epimerase [Bacteroidales bacterium]
MNNDRRKFIKAAALTSLGAYCSFSGINTIFAANTKTKTMSTKKMKLSFKPYDLQMKHTFTIAGNSRTMTPAVLTEIEYDGVTGYGEASMPPYLGETQASVIEFLKKVNLEQFNSPFELDDILTYVDAIAENNTAAKASIDIALHDLTGKLMGQPWHRIWGLNPEKTPQTSYTIGMDTPEIVRQKTLEAPYEILKVKLGAATDKELIESIRSVSQKPIYVDANQGWKDKHQALDMIHWLKERGVVFIEQPMSKHKLDDIAWLTQQSPLPVVADESLQRLSDIKRLKGAFSGINIKLMKCTGMREAMKMVNLARAYDMKVMIGCMTETSCAISAAAQLSPACDWADLDGNILISNDCFTGMKVNNGKIILNELPGIGVLKNV